MLWVNATVIRVLRMMFLFGAVTTNIEFHAQFKATVNLELTPTSIRQSGNPKFLQNDFFQVQRYGFEPFGNLTNLNENS